MKKIESGTLTFGIAATAVLLISIVLDLRRGALQAATEMPRFSGSTIVADLPSLLPAARLPTRLRVAVVRDDAAASYYDSPATLDSIVERWRAELAAIGADARVVRSGALHAEQGAQVLVIPSSPCLTLQTREAIESATARGQGVILTSLTGVYDAGCRRIGFGLIVGMTGASRAEVLDSRPMVYVTLPAGGPLAADLPPGARIEVNPAQHVALRQRGRDAYYSDYSLQPEPAGENPLLDAAVVRSTRGRARVVYWGFELHNVLPRPWSRAVTRLLIRNSVAWAGRASLGWIEPWPAGRKAAAVFAQDVEYEFANARYALDSLRAIGVSGTYFLTSKYASHYKRLTRQLAAAGEIGTHTENHRRLGGAPLDVQRARLQTTQRELDRLLGSPVAGLRPPEEQFDSATMAGWLGVSGEYLLGVNDSRAAAPELLRLGDDTLVLFSRVGVDDVALRVSRMPADTQRYTEAFLNDLSQVRALGGLYLFSYHSQLLSRPALVPVLARVARAVAADSTVWTTTAGEIADWWRARGALQLETRIRDNDFIDLIVRNRNSDSVRNVVGAVQLPDARRVIAANASILSNTGGVVRLALPVIPGKATATYMVRLEPSKTPVVRADRERATARPRYVPRKPEWWKFWKWRRR